MKEKIKVKVLNIVNTIKIFCFKYIGKVKKNLFKTWEILKKIIAFFMKYVAFPSLFLIIFLTLPILFEKIIAILIENKIMTDNLNSIYLDFYGTILSGIFTLIGVVITIKHENNVKKNDETITYKPILAVDGINKNINCMTREVGLGMGYSSSNPDPNRERKCEEFFEQQKSNNPKYRLYIKNKGRGETFNAVLEDFEVASANWDKQINVHSNIGGSQYIGEVLKDEYIGIDVNLPNYLFMPEKMKGVLWYELRTNTIISYSDMFNRVRYQYRIHTVYKVIVEKFVEEQPYFYRNGFKYAKVNYELSHIMPEMRIYSKKHKGFIHEHKYVTEKVKNK